MAVRSPQFDRPNSVTGGADLWDNGLAGALLSDDYFEDTSDQSTGSTIKAWTGVAWADGSLKVWRGSEWSPAILKRWNGAAWVVAP